MRWEAEKKAKLREILTSLEELEWMRSKLMHDSATTIQACPSHPTQPFIPLSIRMSVRVGCLEASLQLEGDVKSNRTTKSMARPRRPVRACLLKSLTLTLNRT